LLWRAVNDQATGIQVESFERELLVRFRTDEALYDVMSAPKCYEKALISRLKEMTGLNVADGQCPQTGHIRLRIAGRVVAARISTMPGAFGEGIVVGLPDSEHEFVDVIENCVNAPCGLAAGTTGPPSCWHCSETIVVPSALFCKDCGVKLIDTALTRPSRLIRWPTTSQASAGMRPHFTPSRSRRAPFDQAVKLVASGKARIADDEPERKAPGAAGHAIQASRTSAHRAHKPRWPDRRPAVRPTNGAPGRAALSADGRRMFERNCCSALNQSASSSP
jgi:hypothetical protein